LGKIGNLQYTETGTYDIKIDVAIAIGSVENLLIPTFSSFKAFFKNSLGSLLSEKRGQMTPEHVAPMRSAALKT
jgi:hypothetical protein